MRSLRKKHINVITIFIIFLLFFMMVIPVSAKQKEIQMKNVRTASFVADEEFFSEDEKSGVRSGYAYEFLTDISDYAGWNYEYEYCGWSEAMDMLLNGKIDVMADVSYTEERAKEMLFSKLPMGVESYYLFVTQESTIRDTAGLNGKRIGVGRNSIQIDMLLDYLNANSITCELVYFDSDEQINEMLNNQEIDGFVGLSTQAESEYYVIENIGESEYYFAINKERPDLKEELDAAMQKMVTANPYYTLELSKKYMNNSKIMQALSGDEKEWLLEKQILNIGYITDCMPYCTLDEEGNVSGVLKNIVETIEVNYAVQTECIPYEDSEVMAEDLKAGKLDAAFALTDNKWVADVNGLALCESFTTDTAVIVYEKNYEKCMHGKLAITKENSFDLPCFQNSLPGVKFVVYRNAEECMDAVFKHEVDGFIIHSNRAYYIVNENAKYYTAKVTNTNEASDYCFAVSKTNPKLLSILNHVNSFYTDEKISNLITKNTITNSEISWKDFVTYNAVSVWVVTIAFSIVIITVISSIYLRTKKLYALSYVDSLTGLNNRNAYERERNLVNRNSYKSLGVIFADINGLKIVNDQQGHKAGDQRIQSAAECLTKCFSKKVVYRISGDEFVIIFFKLRKRHF